MPDVAVPDDVVADAVADAVPDAVATKDTPDEINAATEDSWEICDRAEDSCEAGMTAGSEANCWEALLTALLSPASDVATGADEPPAI